MKNAPDRKAAESALEQRRFYTDNPRHCRALALLLQRPAKREEIDSRAGCSNAPELVAELRRRGLDVPCERVPALTACACRGRRRLRGLVGLGCIPQSAGGSADAR